MSKSPRLGRGLSALMADINPAIEDAQTEENKSQKAAKKTTDAKTPKSASAKPSTKTKSPKADGITIIAINRIDRNPDQPRLHFDKAALAELTESIKERGVLQPILLRPLPQKFASEGKTVKDRYQIVAGERRWQASLAAGLDQMPALIRDFSDREVLEVGVVENVQREDLNPIEEALAFEALKEQFGHRQQGIAQAIGKSRAYVANRMRLLQLPERAREYLVSGKITPGHANAILAYKDPMELTELIVLKNMSVRDAEKYKKATPNEPDKLDPNILHIEREITDHIGLQVSLKHKGDAGSMTIKYKTAEQLEDLMARLKKS